MKWFKRIGLGLLVLLVLFAGFSYYTLKEVGIIPRMMGAYGLGDCLRITIGTEAEMRAARDALAKFVGKA